MKTRNGFVSNSSSSSFVIAVLRRGGISSIISGAADQYYDSDLSALDKDTLMIRVAEGYGEDSVDDIRKRLYGLNDSEYDFFYGEVGYHDEVLRYLLDVDGVAAAINIGDA